MVALAVSAQTSAVIRETQETRTGGTAQQEFDRLSEQEVDKAGDPAFDLPFAIAANEAGQFTRAIIALERVLAMQPGNERARAEMGRALYGVGDHKAARALLSESREKGFTAVAGETIDQLLHAIDRVEAEGRSSAKGYLEAQAGWDSNINSAPGLNNVAVPAYGGTILAVDPAGTKKKGWYGAWTAGASGRLVLGPRFSLIGTAIGRRQDFARANANQSNWQFDISAGASYRVERDEYTLALQAGSYAIDDDRVRDHAGLVGEWTYRFDGFRQFNLYFQTGRLTYPLSHTSDANRHVVGFTYAHLTAKGLWAYGGAYVGVENTVNAGFEHLGHHLVGARGGLQFPIADALGGFLAGGFEARRYGGADPLFLVQRRDNQFNLSAGLSWVPMPQWRVTPQIGWARASSTVPLARYHKFAGSVAIRREF
ncbi:tetratricopeptide repeat protein [Ramlibacter sp. PS4R-6]|uniref:tetratricopeptide repeat protein n=1 Tax=Ramlibacter sp. PS4R-6 TaxID=3133438 RepID=UPI0030B72C17